MKPLLLSLAFATVLHAQDAAQSLRISQTALLGATFADSLSSRGMVERNPVLGRGEFRMSTQGAKALGITAGIVVAQSIVVRKWPKTAGVFKWTNWIGVGAHGAATVHNGIVR